MKDQEIKATAITISTPDLKKLEELEKAGRENDSIENDNFPAESKALQIKNTFEPMVKMIEAVEIEFNEIIDSSKIEVTKDVAKNARALRLKVAKIRTGAESARKAQKASILLQGKAIDGACNVVKWAVSSKEEALEKIENHQKELEILAIRKLQADRVKTIIQYYPDAIERDFTKLSEKEFAELVADKKRDAEEKENLRIENERLKKEQEERELIAKKKAEEKARRNEELSPFVTFIRNYSRLIDLPECEYQKEFSDIKKGAEDHWAYERAEQLRKIKEIDERVEKEITEKLALEATAKAERLAKEQAEKKAIEEKEVLRQAELNRDDSEKVRDLVDGLGVLKGLYSFKSEKNQKMYSEVGILIGRTIEHILK